MAKAYVVLQMLDIGSWATPVYPACDDEFCLATVRRSTDNYRGILFPMQHLQFWDLSSPPLVNPCDGIMEMKWTVRAPSTFFPMRHADFVGFCRCVTLPPGAL